jgi:hypothetical protein
MRVSAGAYRPLQPEVMALPRSRPPEAAHCATPRQSTQYRPSPDRRIYKASLSPLCTVTRGTQALLCQTEETSQGDAEPSLPVSETSTQLKACPA